ncbi:hypothetical protein V6669_23300 [Paenibacillus sp. Y5S-9]
MAEKDHRSKIKLRAPQEQVSGWPAAGYTQAKRTAIRRNSGESE